LFIDKVQEQQKREKSKGEIEAKQTKKKTAKKRKTTNVHGSCRSYNI